MQNLTNLKDKGKESFNRLVEAGKQQPDDVKLWGVTAGAAIVGGLAVAATAKGLLAIVGTLAALPVSLTVGGLAGGAIGWSYMQNQSQATQDTLQAASDVQSVPITTAEAAV